MITFVRSIFGAVGELTSLAVKSEAIGRAFAANAVVSSAAPSWLDRQEESSEVLEPRSFVCNTRAAVPVADPADSLLRYNDIECDVCATEHADFPGARIACGTPGCPNASYPSAPGLGGLVERTTPEGATPTASSGASTSTASGGGTASVVDADDRVNAAARGAGQPDYSDAHLMRIGAMLSRKAAKACHPKDLWYWDWLAAEYGDRAAQFDALDALDN